MDTTSGTESDMPNGTGNMDNPQAPHSPLFVPQETPTPPSPIIREASSQKDTLETDIAIIVPPIERRWEYQTYKEAPVVKVLEECDDGGVVRYLVKLRDGCKQRVSDFFNITW